MKCQLVLQFTAASMEDFDRLVLEDSLIQELEGLATVDGHDFGMGEFNIFILTDDPAECVPSGDPSGGTYSCGHLAIRSPAYAYGSSASLLQRVTNRSRCFRLA